MLHSAGTNKIGNFEFRDDDTGPHPCGDNVTKDRRPILAENKECTFQVGSLSFNLQTTDYYGNDFIARCVKVISEYIN